MLEKTPSEILSGGVRRAGFVEDGKLYVIAQVDRGTNPLDVVVETLRSDPVLSFEYAALDMTADDLLTYIRACTDELQKRLKN